MKQYLDLLEHIQDYGTSHKDRTGTGTTRVFGYQMRFDLSDGFPILTTKKLPFRWIAEELLWMLSGSTNEKDLADKGVDIWKEWATEEKCAVFERREGDLGPVYGHQWRNFGATRRHIGIDNDPEYPWGTVEEVDDDGVDQIAVIIDQLLHTPGSRRILLTGWNPKEATEVALPPCHTLTQFSVSNGKLSCQLYQRSADVFLGVPFNIASYALLTHMLAYVTGLQVGDFVHTFGDVHIYSNHEVQVAEQLCRDPGPLPELTIEHDRMVGGKVPSHMNGAAFMALQKLLDIRYEDMMLHGYKPQSKISAEVSV